MHLFKLILIMVFSILSLFAAEKQSKNLFNMSPKEQIKQFGFANVIVTIKKSDSMTIEGLDSLNDISRISAVQGMQKALLSKMPKKGFTLYKEYKYTPQIYMKINEEILKQLEANPNIEIKTNHILKPILQQSVPRVFPHYNRSSYDGSGYAVAVLDTGVQKTHPFLRGKVVSEACYSGGSIYSSESLCPGGVFSSTANGSGKNCPISLDDDCSHGTHVSGIVAGSNTSFRGVAPGAKIIAIQVFSYYYSLGAYDSDIIDGLERVYALRNRYKIASVNMSLGGGAYVNACTSDPIRPMIRLLKHANIATIVASGNDGYSYQISSPACVPESIAVGSSLDTSDERSYFSNSSSMLDLYAPGSSITSSIVGGGYATWSGTSMATPHVAGAWAVVREAQPNATVDDIERLFKSNGPGITVAGVTRKRIDIDGVLASLGKINYGLDIIPIITNFILTADDIKF